MYIGNHLDFVAPGDIRVRGTRIGIETILTENLYDARTAEEIVLRYPGLALADIHAALAYYRENQEAMEAYLAEWRETNRQARELQDRNPSPAVARLRAIKYGETNGVAGHP